MEQLAVNCNAFFSILTIVASNYTDEELQECCTQGFTPTPMKLTCEERAQRISLVEKNSMCIEVFNKCCREGVRLLQKKMREDSQKGYGRSKKDIFHSEIDYTVTVTRIYHRDLCFYSWGTQWNWGLLLERSTVHKTTFPTELWLHRVWY